MIDQLVSSVNWLRGKKTYLVAMIGLLTALVSYLDGGLSGKEFVFAVFASLGLGTTRAGIAKGGSVLVMLAATGLLLASTGCVTAINSSKIRSATVRGKGLKITAPDGTGIIFGIFSTKYESIPVSTNGPVYAPRYMDTVASADAWSPWSDTASENVASGEVMVGTNATASAIIPKGRAVISPGGTNAPALPGPVDVIK